jgi:protein ImuB
MVTVMQDGNRRVIAAVDEAARLQRLRPGMTVAHAQSLIPNLTLIDATPDEDEAALTQLALWCTRYSPLVTPDPPAGELKAIIDEIIQLAVCQFHNTARRLGDAGLFPACADRYSSPYRTVSRQSLHRQQKILEL